MSWPIGYGNAGYRYRASLDGAIFAQDVQVTEVNGWLDVELPVGLASPGTVEITVRLRLAVDAHGHPFLYAEQVEHEGRRYNGVHALVVAKGPQFVAPLARCVNLEIARRVAGSVRARSEVRMTASRPEAVKSAAADDTWAGLETMRPRRE